MATDEELIASYYDGEDWPFVELYERYWEKLVPFFFHNTGDYHEAEDLTHETLVKIMTIKNNSRIRYSSARGATFYTWAFRIATNKLRDFWRRRGRVVTFTEHEGVWGESENTIPFEENIEETPFSHKPLGLEVGVEAEELPKTVHECLLQLTEQERLVLSLLFMGEEEIPQTEIAEILDVSNSTVTRIKLRAKRKMQTYLNAKGFS